MNIESTIVPDSTQVNADDLIASPVTVTITGVTKGNSEQPVNIELAEFPGRAYRPGKSMRRVLIAAWGPEASAYVGRRITLFRDPDISFGREKTGGIRISHMSHLEGQFALPLTVTRGKRSMYTVQPLVESRADILRAEWRTADDARKKEIEAEVADIVASEKGATA